MASPILYVAKLSLQLNELKFVILTVNEIQHHNIRKLCCELNKNGFLSAPDSQSIDRIFVVFKVLLFMFAFN